MAMLNCQRVPFVAGYVFLWTFTANLTHGHVDHVAEICWNDICIYMLPMWCYWVALFCTDEQPDFCEYVALCVVFFSFIICYFVFFLWKRLVSKVCIQCNNLWVSCPWQVKLCVMKLRPQDVVMNHMGNEFFFEGHSSDTVPRGPQEEAWQLCRSI